MDSTCGLPPRQAHWQCLHCLVGHTLFAFNCMAGWCKAYISLLALTDETAYQSRRDNYLSCQHPTCTVSAYAAGGSSRIQNPQRRKSGGLKAPMHQPAAPAPTPHSTPMGEAPEKRRSDDLAGQADTPTSRQPAAAASPAAALGGSGAKAAGSSQSSGALKVHLMGSPPAVSPTKVGVRGVCRVAGLGSWSGFVRLLGQLVWVCEAAYGTTLGRGGGVAACRCCCAVTTAKHLMQLSCMFERHSADQSVALSLHIVMRNHAGGAGLPGAGNRRSCCCPVSKTI